MADNIGVADELRALDFLRRYARTHYEFLGAGVVRAFAEDGRPPLSDVKTWMRVAATAVEEGLIEHIRNTPAGAANPPSAPIWRSKTFGGSR